MKITCIKIVFIKINNFIFSGQGLLSWFVIGGQVALDYDDKATSTFN